VNRLQGQLEGIRVAIEEEQECASVLQQIAACRGAINSRRNPAPLHQVTLTTLKKSVFLLHTRDSDLCFLNRGTRKTGMNRLAP